jgi:hypothetical protein
MMSYEEAVELCEKINAKLIEKPEHPDLPVYRRCVFKDELTTTMKDFMVFESDKEDTGEKWKVAMPSDFHANCTISELAHDNKYGFVNNFAPVHPFGSWAFIISPNLDTVKVGRTSWDLTEHSEQVLRFLVRRLACGKDEYDGAGALCAELNDRLDHFTSLWADGVTKFMSFHCSNGVDVDDSYMAIMCNARHNAIFHYESQLLKINGLIWENAGSSPCQSEPLIPFPNRGGRYDKVRTFVIGFTLGGGNNKRPCLIPLLCPDLLKLICNMAKRFSSTPAEVREWSHVESREL